MMSSINWKVVVKSNDSKLKELILKVFGRWCSNCNRKTTIQSDKEVGSLLSSMIRRKASSLTCTQCDDVVRLGDADFSRLVGQVTEKVTLAWIEKQITSTPVASEEPDPVEEPDDDEEKNEDEKNKDEKEEELVPLEA